MDTINARFFDNNLKFIGELDAYVGLEFITRWTTYGEFKIFVHNITPIMKKGYYIMLNNDPRKTGIIKRIQAGDSDSTDTQIDGFTLLHLLTQRITYPPSGYAYHSFHAPSEDIMCALVVVNAVDAADSRRNMPLLTVQKSQGRGDIVYYQTRYDQLNDCIQTLCEASGLGAEIVLDAENRKLIFRVLEGVDRSAEQEERPPMIFNRDYDNVYNREYVSDISEYKNTAITAGQGDGAERKIVIVGDSNVGMERYELFVDARDIEDDAQLPDRGNSKLAEYACPDSYSSEVDDSKYGIKWDIGDIVVTIDREYDAYLNERIVEITETFDESGYTVSPTFGSIQKTIIEKVNSIGSNEPLIEGIKGEQGEQGQTGETGPQGYSLQYLWDGTSLGVKREDESSYKYTNLIGPQGKQGIQGVQGIQGEKGETGAVGPKGEKGDKGDPGEQGPQGEQGVQGPAGSTQSYIVFQKKFISTENQKVFSWTDYQFPLGVNALSLYINGVRQPGDGFTENTGGKGITLKSSLPDGYSVFIVGFQMVVDLQGPRGEKGEKGDTGATGLKGDKGDTGAQGPIGPQGATGPRGATGAKGTDGITPSIGTNGNWFLGNTDTGKPSRGAKGDTGAKGATGAIGPAGPQGATGARGATGPRGPAGPKGADGTKIYAQTNAPTGVASGTVWIDI